MAQIRRHFEVLGKPMKLVENLLEESESMDSRRRADALRTSFSESLRAGQK